MKLRKCGLKRISQRLTDHIFRCKMPGIDQIDAVICRIQKNIMLDIGGHKGVAARSHNVREHISAGTATHSHTADRTTCIMIANTSGMQGCLNVLSKP